jgi:hypothetical protein
MRENHQFHILLVTRADYVDHFSQALKVTEGTVNRLHEEVQELCEFINLLAELAADDTLGQEIDRVTAAPLDTPAALPPAASAQLPVTQPVQQATRLSN